VLSFNDISKANFQYVVFLTMNEEIKNVQNFENVHYTCQLIIYIRHKSHQMEYRQDLMFSQL
jgi:hypothetical protein